MKKLLLLTMISSFSFVNAQLLQNDNFNTLTVGNIGTDATGATAGQGGWFTSTTNGAAPTTGTNAGVSNFQVVTTGNTSTQGLKIVSSNGNKGSRSMWKSGLDTAWGTRTEGNEIIEVEYDLFTGPSTTSTAQVGARLYGLDATVTPAATRTLNGFVYTMNTRVLDGVSYLNNAGTYGTYLITLGAAPLVLDENTWYRIGFAYDTTTGETIWRTPTVFTGLPEANWAGPFDPVQMNFVSAVPTTPANSAVSDITFDNLTIRATDQVSLGVVKTVVSENNFSVFPNPTNNVINFSNNVNATVNTIEIFDLNGRIIKSIKINATEGQVSVSDLSAGMYMMKISTDSGIVTKKIVKQ